MYILNFAELLLIQQFRVITKINLFRVFLRNVSLKYNSGFLKHDTILLFAKKPYNAKFLRKLFFSTLQLPPPPPQPKINGYRIDKRYINVNVELIFQTAPCALRTGAAWGCNLRHWRCMGIQS